MYTMNVTVTEDIESFPDVSHIGTGGEKEETERADKYVNLDRVISRKKEYDTLTQASASGSSPH